MLKRIFICFCRPRLVFFYEESVGTSESLSKGNRFWRMRWNFKMVFFKSFSVSLFLFFWSNIWGRHGHVCYGRRPCLVCALSKRLYVCRTRRIYEIWTRTCAYTKTTRFDDVVGPRVQIFRRTRPAVRRLFARKYFTNAPRAINYWSRSRVDRRDKSLWRENVTDSYGGINEDNAGWDGVSYGVPKTDVRFGFVEKPNLKWPNGKIPLLRPTRVRPFGKRRFRNRHVPNAVRFLNAFAEDLIHFNVIKRESFSRMSTLTRSHLPVVRRKPSSTRRAPETSSHNDTRGSDRNSSLVVWNISRATCTTRRIESANNEGKLFSNVKTVPLTRWQQNWRAEIELNRWLWKKLFHNQCRKFKNECIQRRCHSTRSCLIPRQTTNFFSLNLPLTFFHA